MKLYLSLKFSPTLLGTILLYFISTTLLSGQTTITSRVSQGSDDAEESITTGAMDLTSSDLELTSDGANNQLVGIRFQNIYIPQGTTILSASIQFTTDETDSGATSVAISGEDTDNASTFTTGNGNISSRNLTAASVAWNAIPAWNTVGEAGVNQQTPDLTNIVQEIVNRGGWNSGNSMVFIINGLGERTAESYNGDASRAPVLTIVADFASDPLPSIVANPNRGLPFIYFMADNRDELYSVAPDPTASPLPSPTVINTTFSGSSITFSGEGGGYRSIDRQVYVFQGLSVEPTTSSDLYSIDPATGVATLVKTDIVAGHVEGAEFWINNSTGEEVLVIVYQNGTNGGPHRLMAINPNASGSLPAWTPYNGYPIALSGARTFADGISWNPDTSEFYIQDDDNVDYYTIDITTGVTTFAFSTSAAIDGEGITYASDGTNYIEDENSVGQGRTIFMIDTSTGNLIPAAQLGSTGDVESIMGNLGTRNDAGDAPSSYGYAAHILPVLTTTPISIYLGSIPPDSENPFVNYSLASSDDDNGDDEDGVRSGGIEITGQLFDIGQTKQLDIVANGSGYLSGWIDFNRDGDFDDFGEQIASDITPTGGTITLNVNVPGTAVAGTSYARFRYSSETGLSPGNTEAQDGEVEDYRIVFRDNSACSPGFVQYENLSTTYVSATSVIVDQSVGNENNALGSNNTTTASFNNNNDELVLEMGDLIGNGDLTTVHGVDGNRFNIWVSSSATGPWTFIGNGTLDFTFTSPIDWQYIRLMRGTSSTQYLSYIEAQKTIRVYTCELDSDGDNVPDFTDVDDDNDGISDCTESSDTVSSSFMWSLNNPSGNLTMDTVYDTKITDWALDATTNMNLNTGIFSVVGSNVQITGMSASSLQEAMINGDYIEVSFTTGVEASSFVLENIISGWYEPYFGDSYYSTAMYAEASSANWATLSKDVFHTNDGSGNIYLTFDHMNATSISLKSNTEYRFRIYVYGQVDDSGQSYSIFDDINFTISACRSQNMDGDASVDHLDTDSDDDGCSDANEAYANGNADEGDNDYFGSGNPPATNIDGTVIGASYTTPTDSNGNGTADHLEAGTAPIITIQPQDQDVADGADVTFSITATGSSLIYQWQVSTDGGANFNNISGATSNTYTITGVSAPEDGNQYRVLITDNAFICAPVYSMAAILTISPDTDNDGILDSVDLDDDNDGILDTVEANECALGDTSIDYVIFSEDFGAATGSRASTPYTNYPFEDGTGSAGGSTNLQDGEYTIFEDISVTGSWAPTVWQSLGDHTTGSDRMMIVNADNTPGLEFYRRTLVQVVQNVPLNISLWVMNLDIDTPANDGRTEPDITVLIQQGGSTVYSFNTGAVAREADGASVAWKNYTGSFTPNLTTALEIVMINNAPGGSGNDLALDDIVLTQSFCDSDNDGIPNSLEADSDGDGCNDSDEAYADPDADSDNNGMYGTGIPAVNPDGTVVTASYSTPADGDGNTVFDFLEAGTAPSITTQPLDTTICPGCTGTISVVANDADTFQWQIFNGSIWVDLNDTGIYGGTDTNSLVITNPTTGENGNQYRVLVSNTAYVCSLETSSSATLSVQVNTVITNRRITYRVNKN